MSENWPAIAADVLAAIGDVGFTVTITREVSGPSTPSDATPYVTETLTCTAIDRKPRKVRIPGTAEVRTVRSILVGAGGSVPVMGDILTIRGVDHQAGPVEAIAPGGVDLLWIVELAT